MYYTLTIKSVPVQLAVKCGMEENDTVKRQLLIGDFLSLEDNIDRFLFTPSDKTVSAV